MIGTTDRTRIGTLIEGLVLFMCSVFELCHLNKLRFRDLKMSLLDLADQLSSQLMIGTADRTRRGTLFEGQVLFMCSFFKVKAHNCPWTGEKSNKQAHLHVQKIKLQA